MELEENFSSVTLWNVDIIHILEFRDILERYMPVN
jgi:hypothetical protein